MRHVDLITRDLRQAEKDFQNAQQRLKRYRAELQEVASTARLALAA